MATLVASARHELFGQTKAKARPHAGLDFHDFDAIRLTLASPEQIRSWSYGEVRKPETINYRTFKPERDGLFCERIFGPVRDWECSCGKYKYIKYKGTVCDRCGVEVTEAKVRRVRLGQIELAASVVHIWYLRKAPSLLGIVLDMRVSDLEKIVYYARSVAVEDIKGPDGKVYIKAKTLLSDEDISKAKKEIGSKFRVEIGAKAVQEMLGRIDLKVETVNIRAELKATESDTEKTRLLRRLRVLDGMLHSGNRPEWMILTVLPVLPPDLRPLVPLEGGRFATSDLNDLYRRIINRNNRLKHIEALRAPDVMIHNEKRLLQEAVDALFENGARGKVVVGAANRPLKSLSDVLSGKQGRFRQNLLGKRVDYSGRSVIVVGPKLKFNQCGLPKEMALELFKPFILHEVMKRFNVTLKAAKRMLERAGAEVWDILEQITKNHPVLLNRAPTLHRLGIQAFEPILIEGKSIQIHPLTCAAFNADFDGDQMAVHVPLSSESRLEAKLLMMAPLNILSPASGKPIATPSQDIVLGCCYLTKPKFGDYCEGKIFSDAEEVIASYQNGVVGLHAVIKVRGINNIDEEGMARHELSANVVKWKDYTTVGRVIFNEVLPKEFGFLNQTFGKKEMSVLVERTYREISHSRAVDLLDSLKELGYHYATKAGFSITLSDMHVPQAKKDIVSKAKVQVKEIERQSKIGIITDSERYNKIIDLWTRVTDQIADSMFEEMRRQENAIWNKKGPKFNSVFMMADSGARGSRQQVRQLAGMRGLMQKPQKKITGAVGEIIESPVIANFREGLSVLEYFISTHGGRKGLADTALKTADAGYLTRRLVDVAHDVVITMEDCPTVNGVSIGTLRSGEDIIEPIEDRVIGRVALDNVVNPLSDEVIVKTGDLITEIHAKKIVEAGIDRIRIRSLLTCEAPHGVCSKCYGLNLAIGRLAEVGEAVGIIAAQSIGEPGTQLTLRTFHIGGTASRIVKRSQAVAQRDGVVKFYGIRTIQNREGQLVCVLRNGVLSLRDQGGQVKEHYDIPYGAKIKVHEGKKVVSGEVLAEWDPYSLPIITEYEGIVKLGDVIEGVTMHEAKNKVTGLIERVIIEHRAEKLHPQVVIQNKSGKVLATYPLPVDTNIVAQDGDKVEGGDVLAKIPQEVSKTKDITGGLPRVAELFEARRPKNAAVISEIDGIVKLGMTARGILKVTVTNQDTGLSREYLVPQGKHLVVYEGDRVGVGEPLTDGPVNPHDILKVKGAKEVQEFLVNEIQEVYRLQGVIINDKHIELMVRQMLSNIIITKFGDTEFLPGDMVSKQKFITENRKVIEAGGVPAEAQPILLGITKASLSSDSFISAASFQETTRVLTEVAASGRVDRLLGLKENVIIGHLIPAGTGFWARRRIENEKLAQQIPAVTHTKETVGVKSK